MQIENISASHAPLFNLATQHLPHVTKRCLNKSANLEFNEVKAQLSKAHFSRVIILTCMFCTQLQNNIVLLAE